MAASRTALPERGADDGGERGARALARASRDDQRHDRARGNDQDRGYYEESGEQFPIHDASMLRSRSASSSAKADDPAMTVKNWGQGQCRVSPDGDCPPSRTFPR